MKQQLNLILLAALIAGCSSSGGGGGGGTPAGAVNSKLDANGTQALTGQAALLSATQSMGGASSHNADAIIAGFVSAQISAAANQKSVTQSAIDSKADRVSKAVHSTACQIDLKQPTQGREGQTGGVAGNMKPMEVSIKGASCPLEMQFSMVMSGMSGASPCQEVSGAMNCNFNVAVKMNYRVLDAQLAKDLNVSSGNMDMTMTVSQTLPAGQSDMHQASAQALKLVLKLESKVVDSQNQAYLIGMSDDVDMKTVFPAPSSEGMAMPQQTGGRKEELHYSGPNGVTSSLSATETYSGAGKPQASYLVDGVSVTLEAYTAEREKFGVMITGANGQGGDQQDVPSESQPINPGQPNNPPQHGWQPPQQPTNPEQPPQNGWQPPQNPNQPPVQPPVVNPPATNPADGKFVCVIKNYANKDVFVGYGSVAFVATSKAKQACQAAYGSSCSSSADCEEQESNPAAWYCENKNYADGRLYSGTGASKTEAAYAAAKDCFKKSGTNSSACTTTSSSECAHQ